MSIELGMTKYIFEHNDKIGAEKIGYIRYAVKTYKHALFLESPPQLFEFVACDADGEPMDKPGYMEINIYKLEYESAQSRVIWKSWKRDEIGGKIGVSNQFGDFIPYYWINEKQELDKTFTIYEKLIDSGVKLERIETT